MNYRVIFHNVYISVCYSSILKKKVKKIPQKEFNWNQYHATAKFLKRYEYKEKTEKEIKEEFFQKCAELVYEQLLEPLGW